MLEDLGLKCHLSSVAVDRRRFGFAIVSEVFDIYKGRKTSTSRHFCRAKLFQVVLDDWKVELTSDSNNSISSPTTSVKEERTHEPGR